MSSKAKIIQSVCEHLAHGDSGAAKAKLISDYRFVVANPDKRTYTPKESMSIFGRDGFIDRYSGSRLIFPGTLRLIHRLIPDEFPFHTNWKMSETHIAFWELFPTIDHIKPIARGGPDHIDNWVSTSQLRNSAKSNWLLEELGWKLSPPGDLKQWDGLTNWFIDFVEKNPNFLKENYIKTWHKAAISVA